MPGIGGREVPKQIKGFRMLKDYRPRTQVRMRAYERVRVFSSTTNSARLSLQYKLLLPWLDQFRFCLIADDDDGLTREQVESAIASCVRHKLLQKAIEWWVKKFPVDDEMVVVTK